MNSPRRLLYPNSIVILPVMHCKGRLERGRIELNYRMVSILGFNYHKHLAESQLVNQLQR